MIEKSTALGVKAGTEPILQSPIEESLPASMAMSPKVGGVLGRLGQVARALPLPWTHYVRLLRVRNVLARAFYAREALAGGWSVRQLARQINSQFYEHTALSKNKAAMLVKGEKPKPGGSAHPPS